jgi:hypothetical protein
MDDCQEAFGSLARQGGIGAGAGIRSVRNAEECPDLFADDGFATGNFVFALLQVIVGNGLKVVDIVQINVLEKIHIGLDVARDGDIYQQERAVFAGSYQRLEFDAIEDVMRR